MFSFYKALFKHPRKVGAIVPSSRRLANLIAAHVAQYQDTLIIELGPGTGVITQALLQQGVAGDRIIAIDNSPDMVKTFKNRFPNVRIIQGNAANLKDLLANISQPIHTIISSLPLLLFPEAIAHTILSQIDQLLPADGLYIQYTYGTKSNLIDQFPRFHKTFSKRIWFNVPPARIDAYQIIGNTTKQTSTTTASSKQGPIEIATFAGGCFWGVEAVFRQAEGVLATTVGYTGGTTANPTYKQVCSGKTHHAEAVQIEFDPTQISYETLLTLFFENHTPTTLNRQGLDIGSQYRSAIFTHNEQQEKLATEKIAQLTQTKQFSNPIVTEIQPATTFYRAEEDHQQYLEKHGRASCTLTLQNKK